MSQRPLRKNNVVQYTQIALHRQPAQPYYVPVPVSKTKDSDDDDRCAGSLPTGRYVQRVSVSKVWSYFLSCFSLRACLPACLPMMMTFLTSHIPYPMSTTSQHHTN
jgi:hypothetical protein